MEKTHRKNLNTNLNTLTVSRTAPISPTLGIFLLIVLHIGLALLMRNVRIVATIHAILTFILALWAALTKDNLTSVIPYVAYITGAEVLWRMNEAGVFWEFGKYATIAILLIALIKYKQPLKNAGLSIVFMLLFLPSIFLTTSALGLTDRARDFLSFNLTGPIATGICILFFSQVSMNKSQIEESIWSLIYPVIGILTLAVYSTLTATAIEFGGESVFVTSGGFGPNQVSAVLGLGALMLIIMIMIFRITKGRFLSIVLALGLITQSFLTFSRGGVYNLAIALTAALFILMLKPTRYIRAFFIVFVIILIIGIWIFPRLEALTSGALSARFKDLDTTNRIELAKTDIQIWLKNPVFGIGPGMASTVRLNTMNIAAHTEYTRILAEHGSFGALALLFLIMMLIKAYFTAPGLNAKAWVVAVAGWSLVEMAHASMRIVAISLLLGLAFIKITEESSPNPQPIQKQKNVNFYKRI